MCIRVDLLNVEDTGVYKKLPTLCFKSTIRPNSDSTKKHFAFRNTYKWNNNILRKK